MEVRKASAIEVAGEPTAAQLAAINAQAKGKLTADQVYAFSVRLCDDQVDRDWERFDTAALPQLAKLFLGKTGIVDHRWSTDSQVARIFETQVIREDGVSYIKAWAYIRRGDAAREIIADIEAGIKKEVSIGCSMGRSVCSVCGSEYGTCGHRKGEHYDGLLCCVVLKEPVDAYEFSFVAVPAQRDAGVMKGLGRGKQSLKSLAEEFGVQGEYRALFQEAQLGKQYRTELENGVVRLCLSLELGAEEPVLRGIVSKAAAPELMALKTALERKMEELYPMRSQLWQGSFGKQEVESGFLI
jgi:hypothetical protein